MNNAETPFTGQTRPGELDLLLAIKRAQDGGFSGFAEALRELHKREYPRTEAQRKRQAVKASFSSPPFDLG